MLSVLVSFVAAVFHVLIPAATAQTSSKYRLVPQKMTYEAARSHCRSEYGTDLASIHNTADNDEAKNLCASGGENCWFGLTDLAQEHVFLWEDGTAFDYGTDVSGGVYPWHSSQPDDGQRDAPFDSEECCELRVGFEYNWNDDPCSATKYFICNLDATPATTQQPTRQPTANPSQSPTGSSQTPTNNPSLNPTSTPTDSTSMPTKGPAENPSGAASERQVEHSTTPVSTADEATGSSASPFWRNMQWAWAWVSIALCVLCCACSAYGFYYYRKKKDMSERDREEVAREMPSAAGPPSVPLNAVQVQTPPPVSSAVLQPQPAEPAPSQWEDHLHVRSDTGASELMYDDPDIYLATDTTRTGQEQTKQVPLDASQYAAWTSDEVVRWIVDLNYEAHKQYATRLRAAFAADIVNGKAMSGVSERYLKQCGVGDVHCQVILQNMYKVIRRHGAELSLELEEEEQAEDEEEGEGEVNCNTGTTQEPENRTEN